jgi:hemin uptake protein HemP
MATSKKKIEPSPAQRARTPQAAAVQRVRSAALLGEKGELIIEHAGREYRLRQTSTGKLILTA